MKTATPIQNAMIPFSERKDDNGINWLQFKYSNDDKVMPYRWAKAIRYDGRAYVWMSYNSDMMNVYYKEIPENQIAYPLKRKAR